MGASPFADATVAGMLDRVAAAHPDREAIVFAGERLTFRAFRDRAERLARGLAALGIGHDDKVAIWLPNRPSWFVAQYACAELGAVVVALNPRYRFRGRLREVLRISHFMVAPGEIEGFLMSHPAVHQAFVVGVPDAQTNEAAVAYVIAKPGAQPTENDIKAFCRGRIASFKIPRVVRFVDDVPRTPSPHGEKVQRGKLREQALRELGLGKEIA